MREETVTVKIDHPLGSTDEDNPSVVYPINCGYVDVERTAGFSDGKMRVYGGCRNRILWKTCIFFSRTVENFKRNPLFCQWKLSFQTLKGGL